jgi:hypothetical protein
LELPETLEKLPDGISNLISLKMLDLTTMNFRKVPDVSKMKKLKLFSFTLLEGEYYADNQMKLKKILEEHPQCNVVVYDRSGKTIREFTRI